MYLVRLMWRSASESKPVHSRYSRLSQAWRMAKPIRIISAVSNWFRRRTSHELNSLNSIRLMWSTASEPDLIRITATARVIEWSLRAFASMRAVRFFLRAPAVINFLMRVASTLEITNGEQRALHKLSASWNLSLLKRCLARSNLDDTFKTGQKAHI